MYQKDRWHCVGKDWTTTFQIAVNINIYYYVTCVSGKTKSKSVLSRKDKPFGIATSQGRWESIQ